MGLNVLLGILAFARAVIHLFLIYIHINGTIF